MEQNPSNKNPETMVDNGGWFSLPDDIIENIVSHLDIPGSSTITISATTFQIIIYSNIPGLWSILDNLFTVFFSPFITNFHLRLPHTVYKEPSSSIIFGSWIRHLRARNLQHLFLGCSTVARTPHLSCPPIIFRLHSLVSLDIGWDFSIRITMTFCNSITLPKLKVLKLGYVDCYQSLELILSVCPSLESLSLRIEDEQPRKGKLNSPVLIAAKNLKQLLLHLESDSNSIIEVTIDAPKLEDFDYISNCFILMRMYNSISHVKSLKFRLGTLVRLYNSPTKTIFPNLSHLTLAVSGKYEKIDAIFSMLRDCPNLKVLNLELIDFKHMSQIPIARITPIVEHLKQITVYVYHDRLNEHMTNGVMYLLRISPVLEKLIIDRIFTGFNSKSDIARFHQTLLKCPKASPSCEIEFSRY